MLHHALKKHSFCAACACACAHLQSHAKDNLDHLKLNLFICLFTLQSWVAGQRHSGKNMASRNPVHSLPEKIHSLLGLKSHLTSSWVKSVCDIIRNQPSQGQSTETHLTITNFEINSCSENCDDDDDDLSNAASNIRGKCKSLGKAYLSAALHIFYFLTMSI